MEAMNDVAAELVGQLIAAFPLQSISERTRALWVEQVEGVSEATARAVVQMLIQEQREFPVPTDFWRAVDRHRETVALYGAP